MMKLFPEELPRSDLAAISRSAAARTQRRSMHHRTALKQVIWEFAKTRDRIVYGGAALFALLGDDTDTDTDTDTEEDTDIEFYSPEPGRDVVELCDLLRDMPGNEFVQGREAVHAGTLTVSVAFRRCCDITFMPRRTLAAMPTLLARGVRCMHPHVMAMDLMRMLTEPDTSYWRLEKAYARMRLLEQHYPLSWGVEGRTGAGIRAGDGDGDPGVQLAKDPSTLAQGLQRGSAVLVGAHAAVLFEAGADVMGSSPMAVQLVCVCYNEDVRAARTLLADLGTAFKEVHLDAFGDLLGRSTRFLDHGTGECMIELIDAHPRCVPCCASHGPMVASSIFCLVTAMACHLRAFVTGDWATLAQQALICTRLLSSRQSPGVACEDFGIDHIIGCTVPDMRLHMLAKSRSRGRSQASWLRYTPTSADSASQARRMWLMTFPARTGRVVVNGTRMSAQHT